MGQISRHAAHSRGPLLGVSAGPIRCARRLLAGPVFIVPLLLLLELLPDPPEARNGTEHLVQLPGGVQQGAETGGNRAERVENREDVTVALVCYVRQRIMKFHTGVY